MLAREKNREIPYAVLRCRRGAVARAAVQLQDGRSQDSSQDPLQGGYVCGGSRRETPRDVFIVTVRYHNREQYKQKGLAPHCNIYIFRYSGLEWHHVEPSPESAVDRGHTASTASRPPFVPARSAPPGPELPPFLGDAAADRAVGLATRSGDAGVLVGWGGEGDAAGATGAVQRQPRPAARRAVGSTAASSRPSRPAPPPPAPPPPPSVAARSSDAYRSTSSEAPSRAPG